MSDASSAVNFPNRGPAVCAVTTATLVLCSVFVISRMICRLGIVHRIGWDDYFIILAWLLAFGLSLTINLGTRTGLGRYDVNIPPDSRAKLRIREYVFSILYVSSSKIIINCASFSDDYVLPRFRAHSDCDRTRLSWPQKLRF